MTRALQQLVAEARAVTEPGAGWITDGGRACPLGWDDCSQPVFRRAGTDHYDYGTSARGPGARWCAANCPHRLRVPDWLADPDELVTVEGVREERAEAESFLKIVDGPPPPWKD